MIFVYARQQGYLWLPLSRNGYYDNLNCEGGGHFPFEWEIVLSSAKYKAGTNLLQEIPEGESYPVGIAGTR